MICRAIKYAFLQSLAAGLVLLIFTIPVFGESVYMAGSELPHAYINRDGTVFLALADIQGTLGISVIYDGQRLLVGGTINGSLSVDPDSEVVNIGGRLAVNFDKRVFQEDGIWYVPQEFMERVLGIKPVLEPVTGELFLYPMVVSIIPADGAIRIKSSMQPDIQPFELIEPSRRVIDFNGAWLDGQPIEIAGSEVGIESLALLRASQFSFDPPIARVVLEWEGDEAPRHTIYPDNKILTVLINSTGSTPAGGASANLLDTGEGTFVEIEVSGHPATTEQEPPVTESAEADVVTPDPQEPQDSVVDGAIFDGADGPEIIVPPVPELGGNPGSDEFPEGAEDWPLTELGWTFEFELAADGGLEIVIDTPSFEDISEFTLAGNGMRLVVDLLGTYIPGGERRLDGIGDIEQVRVAQFQPSTTRIVFDITRVVAYEVEDDPEEGTIIVRLLSGDLSGKTFVIDPGHGGEDPGAIQFGLAEKDLNLEMAFYLKEFLEAHGARIVMTRETDVYISLARRVEIAQQVQPDFFISIHNNSTEEPTAIQGAMILYDGDKEPEQGLLPLYRLIHRGIAARTGVPGLGPVPDSRGLYIFRYIEDVPAFFVEGAFLSNQIDHARLADPSRAYARNIMAGVMDGVLAYYTGRDLPPVVRPVYAEDIETGVFDLAGRPIVLPGSDVDNASAGEGSAWDTPGEISDDDSGGGEDSEESVADDEEETDRDRLRGRGAYRYEE